MFTNYKCPVFLKDKMLVQLTNWATRDCLHPCPNGTNVAGRVYLFRGKGRLAMHFTKIALAGVAALTMAASPAPAQQTLTGTVTKVDRINRTIAVQRTETGTTGASSGAPAEEFKAQEGLSLDTVHAGDRVSFSAAEANGIKTITKVQKQ
jgi:Cu/Ag efflux protein CusF